MTIQLYHGDCLEIMPTLDKADAVIADPPYNISKASNLHTMKDRVNKRVGTDFGEWDVGFDNTNWIACVSDLMVDGASLLAFNGWTMATIVNDIATNNGLVYKDTLVWKKTNPMPRNRDRRFVSNIEMMQLFVTKKGRWTFNRQSDKYDGCVMEFASESGGGFKRYHPTQKPIKMIEKIILTISNDGDTILDPFMGSGTTGVACVNLNRNFIGIEKEEKYFNIAKKRIEEAERKLF